MHIQSRIAEAVRNNARWCDTMCRVHGAPGEFHDAYWIHPDEVPPYTSKLITLDPERAPDQMGAIQSLIEADPSSAFSVKDAFQCLDLAPLGFEVLFHATWIVWTPGTELPSGNDYPLEWSVVADVDGLAKWELAWRASSAHAALNRSARVFPPSLLRNPAIHFLSGKRDGVTVATAALNRTGDVVGLSNVTGGGGDVGSAFPECVRLAQGLYPFAPIVGYERGDGLVAAEQAGFEGIHPLTVWTRSPK